LIEGARCNIIARMTNRLLVRLSSFALLAVFASCGGGQSTVDRIEGACLRNDECAATQFCLLGMCGTADGTAPLDVAEVNAEQWFSEPEGSCSYDTECGPWMCFDGQCVPPQQTNRAMLARQEFRYFDGSCNFSSDCGPWSCADGWCTQPGYASDSAILAPDEDPPVGVSCLSDNQCPEDADCVFPGQCVAGAAVEPMTFADVAALDWYLNSDGSCTADTECGPHLCEGGWCAPAELLGYETPLRNEIFFFDGSCSEEEHCGPWTCSGGWCHEPSRL
jgi:hypothetical protein